MPAPAGIYAPGAIFFWGALLFLVLLRTELELDRTSVPQVDLEIISAAPRQVARNQVEDPHPRTRTKVERRVRNIVVGGFVYVIHGTPQVGYHSYRAAAACKHRIRVRD